jgi:hypothetical protein
MPNAVRSRRFVAAALSIALATLAGCFSSTGGPEGPPEDGGGPGLDSTTPDAPAPEAAGEAAVDAAPEATQPAAEAAAAEGGPDAGVDSVAEATVEAGAVDAYIYDGPALIEGGTFLGGTITGQTGSIVLQLDGTDDLTVPANATTFQFSTGLAPGAPYFVTVLTPPANQACVVTGGSGTVSDQGVVAGEGGVDGGSGIGVACGIAPPNDLAVTVGTESATLTWTAVPGATGYNLYEGSTSGGEPMIGSPTTHYIATTGTTTLTATVTGLQAGVEDFFFLTSVDSSYNEGLVGSNEVHVTVEPLAPTLVTVTPGDSQVTLTWNSVQFATSYNVYYSTTGTLPATPQVTGAVAGVPITGLTNGTQYNFKVTAVALGTEGPLSNVIVGTPGSALAASIANLANKGVVHSGVVIGRASGTGLSAVQVSIDGGTYVAATGTANWAFTLPSGGSTWKEGTAHTISVRSTDGTNYSPVASITVRKGTNEDVNGDGYADVVVGDPSYGKVYVFESAGPTGVASASASGASLTFTSTDPSFGAAVTLGDINGDGYADVVVGTGAFSYYFGYCNSSGVTNAYVFQSAGAPVQSAASTAATTTLTGMYSATYGGGCFGGAVAVGDIDGDGYADLVVGASGTAVPPSATGAVYIFRSAGASGIASGAYTTATASISGPVLPCNPSCEDDEFGAAVAVGDVNGDGYADVAVGDLQYTGSDYEAGGVLVFNSPGPAGITGATTYSSANAVLTGPGPANASGGSSGLEGAFGITLGIGDLNGDGYGDLVVGAPYAVSSNPTYWEYDVGTVYAFESAGSSGIASAAYTQASVTIEGPLASSCCRGQDPGLSVAVGDVNADGYADIAVTAENASATYIFQSNGGPIQSGDTSTAATTLTTAAVSLVAMGDTNGDGFMDVINAVGSSAYIFESVGTAVRPNGDLGTANQVITGGGGGLSVAP